MKKIYFLAFILLVASVGYFTQRDSEEVEVLVVENVGADSITKEQKYKDLIASSSIDVEIKKLATKEEQVELKSYTIKDKLVLGHYLFENGQVVDKKGKDVAESYKIEITQVDVIDGGIQIFARAWLNGKQLGFGKDNTIETERFRIFNPPVLVDDSNGTIVRVIDGDEKSATTTRTLREDPAYAIQQVIGQNVTLVGEISNKIKAGSIGNTTDTFYPAAGASDPVDGTVGRASAGTFSAVTTGAGTYADNTATANNPGYINTPASPSGRYNSYYYDIFLFGTAAIADTDTIDSATLSIYGAASASTWTGATWTVNVYSQTTASESSVATGDYYSGRGSTAFSTGLTVAGTFSTGAYNDYALNASGLANISKTDNSKFATSFEEVVTGSEPTWEASRVANANCYMADDGGSGTTRDPKLVVVHSAAAPAAEPIRPSFLLISLLTPTLTRVSYKV